MASFKYPFSGSILKILGGTLPFEKKETVFPYLIPWDPSPKALILVKVIRNQKCMS
jgi:hypothetical protein